MDLRAISLCLGLTFSACSSQTGDDGPELTISIASSLSFAFDDLVPLFEGDTGIPVLLNVGSSGRLAQQIERGAPVDLFASADASYLDELSADGLVNAATRTIFARDRLAIWSREDEPSHVVSLADLAADARIAIANPRHAPFGVAARSALQRTTLWDQLQPQLIIAENVRQALHYAESGNVDAALVSAGLASHAAGHWQLVPQDLYEPVEQTIAVLRAARFPTEARRFIEFLKSLEARAVLNDHGLVTD